MRVASKRGWSSAELPEETLRSEEHEIGIVCGHCDTWSSMGTPQCPTCSNDLALFSKGSSIQPVGGDSRPPQKAGSALAMMAMRSGSARGAEAPRQGNDGAVTTADAARSEAQADAPRSEFADLSQELSLIHI